MCGSDAQKGLHGRDPRVRYWRLQGGNSDRPVFIQTQGSSDQVLAVKQMKMRFPPILYIPCLRVNGGVVCAQEQDWAPRDSGPAHFQV